MRQASSPILLSILLTGTVTLFSSLVHSADPKPLLQVNEQEPYGRYLTDRQKRSLYLFSQDEPGSASTCVDECVNAWPPYTVQGDLQLGKGLDSSKLDSIEREDGSKQVTYAGWPLYYFSGDKRPGDALGQDVNHLGSKWYLVSPDGEKVSHGERSQAEETSDE
ncbi:hypothetical protein [Halomonas sp. M20]|uniref:COG4315 family predicted lipoprotein n=1 Tax=Halomonas sp. M20 TaxID=2763264 RepID=UPI001D09C1A1|nr:hypothetical protein [Halomonas sp. M20]